MLGWVALGADEIVRLKGASSYRDSKCREFTVLLIFLVQLSQIISIYLQYFLLHFEDYIYKEDYQIQSQSSIFDVDINDPINFCDINMYIIRAEKGILYFFRKVNSNFTEPLFEDHFSHITFNH